MSNYTKIELELKKRLEQENEHTLFSSYDLARDYLFKNIYPKIGGILPNHTYHDGSHVINVLDNIYILLGDSVDTISDETLYFLCLSVLFHDVGLIYGRDGHEKNIHKVFDSLPERKDIHKYGNERKIILMVGGAHTGEAIDGTNDTLKYLGDQSGYSERIDTQEIAAILKFADELAEGGQRTSDFFIEKDMYEKKSKIFQMYSQAYKVIISPKDNRLAINFNITFSKSSANILMVDDHISLEDFLIFIYKKIIKIDDERKYCRYYCAWLDSIKEISVDFDFWYNSEHIEIGLDPIIFSDKIVPPKEAKARKLEDLFSNYAFAKIDSILRENLEAKPRESL